jgi:peptidoglycan/LPS O-acetylase OafA/YrhL
VSESSPRFAFAPDHRRLMFMTRVGSSAPRDLGHAFTSHGESATTKRSAVDRPRYRPDIDGLRAIAVVAVVAYHAGVPGVGGGYVGVDIFFVISGFLITGLLVDEGTAAGRVRFAEFYARRARRLIPALAVMLASVLILGRVFLSVLGEQQMLAKSAIATLLFSSNFFFMQSTGGYFDPAATTQPLLHTWSLGVEEQFYVVWPLMVHLVARLVNKRPANFEARLRFTLVAVFAASLGFAIWATVRHPSIAFYMMPSRAWEFAAGGLVALNLGRLAQLSNAASAALGVAGMIAIIGAVALFGEDTAFPGVAALLPVAGAAAIIGAGISRHRTPVMRVLSSNLMVFIGLVSYPWYLWHWPFLVIARVTSLGHHSLVRDVGLALVSLLLAVFTRDWIERRFRKPTVAIGLKPWRTIAGACAASAAVLAIAFGVGLSARADMHRPVNLALYHAKADRPWLRFTCNIKRASVLQPSSLCLGGDTSSRRQIVLWGDSHAEHLMALADLEGRAESTAVLQRARSACPPLLGVSPVEIRVADGDAGGLSAARDCASFNGQVVDELTKANGSRTTVGVLLSARWPAYLGVDSPFDDAATFALGSTDGQHLATPGIELLTNGLNATLSAIQRAGVRILVVAPTPFLPFSGPDCLATHRPELCRVPRREVERLRAPALKALHSVTDRYPNVRVWDPIDGLCDAEYCGATYGGIIVYRDLGHLTTEAVQSLDARARSGFDWLVAR